jgi:hypothetical protein
MMGGMGGGGGGGGGLVLQPDFALPTPTFGFNVVDASGGGYTVARASMDHEQGGPVDPAPVWDAYVLHLEEFGGTRSVSFEIMADDSELMDGVAFDILDEAEEVVFSGTAGIVWGTAVGIALTAGPGLSTPAPGVYYIRFNTP